LIELLLHDKYQITVSSPAHRRSPAPQNYDSDDEVVEKKAPNSSKAPNLADQEAFPDSGFGSGTAAAASAPKGGKSFASLASEVLPEQKGAC